MLNHVILHWCVFIGKPVECSLPSGILPTTLQSKTLFRYSCKNVHVKHACILIICNCWNISTLLRANWVRVNGTKYQTPCALVVEKSDDKELLFGKVISILVGAKCVIFEFQLLKSEFCHHYHCYSLSLPPLSTHQYFIRHCDLLFPPIWFVPL